MIDFSSFNFKDYKINDAVDDFFPLIDNCIISLQKYFSKDAELLSFEAIEFLDTYNSMILQRLNLITLFHSINLNESMGFYLKAFNHYTYYEQTIYGDPSISEKIIKISEREGFIQNPIQKKLLDDTTSKIRNFGYLLSEHSRNRLLELKKIENCMKVDYLYKLNDSRKLNYGNKKLVLEHTLFQSVLLNTDSSEIRRNLFYASNYRFKEHDVYIYAELIKMVEIRNEISAILGYNSYANMRFATLALSSPQEVMSFLKDMLEVDMKIHSSEKNILEKKYNTTINSWDWDYFSHNVLLENPTPFEFNPMHGKIFELKKTIEDGLFSLAFNLFNVEFKEIKTCNVWNDLVKVFEVSLSSENLGVIYLDLFQRSGKGAGAWMGSITDHSTHNNSKPMIYIITNFEGDYDESVIDFTEYKIIFHEFGHALQSLICKSHYDSHAGTKSIPYDFLEFPSQLFEMLSTNSDTLRKSITVEICNKYYFDELIDYFTTSDFHGSIHKRLQMIYASLLDLECHSDSFFSLASDLDSFEEKIKNKYNITDESIYPRYNLAIFQHIWADDYSCYYFCYLWGYSLALKVCKYYCDKHNSSEKRSYFIKKVINTLISPCGEVDLFSSWNSLNAEFNLVRFK